jgi:hypothetical protein
MIDLSTLHRAPRASQAEGLRRSVHEPAYALLYDPRVGKSKVVTDTLTLNYRVPPFEIDAALIISWPSGVNRVWIEDELPKDLPPDLPVRAVVWRSGKMDNKNNREKLAELLKFPGLSVLSMNCEALNTPLGWAYVAKFLKARRCVVVADEDWAASPGSSRTKRLLAIGRHPNAVMRRFLSGTPADESPLDLYAPFCFLDWHILGYRTFWSFKSRYAELEERYLPSGHTFKQVIGYQNLDELQEKLSKFSHRVRRSEVSDAPAKTYQKRYFQLSPRQRQFYDKLRDEYSAELSQGEVAVPHVLDRLTKLSMVARGYYPPQRVGVVCPRCEGDGCAACGDIGVAVEVTKLERIDPEHAPAGEALAEELRLARGPLVVWCRFIVDVDDAIDTLRNAGRAPGRYDGTIGQGERESSYLAFKAGEVDSLVATGTSGLSRGHDLSRAETLLYYSDGYSLRSRRQTEDRAETVDRRISTGVVDLIAENTVDEARVAAQREKLTLAEMLMRDPPSRWL